MSAERRATRTPLPTSIRSLFWDYDARRLRYWQLMLDLPARQVTSWIRDPARQVWDRREKR